MRRKSCIAALAVALSLSACESGPAKEPEDAFDVQLQETAASAGPEGDVPPPAAATTAEPRPGDKLTARERAELDADLAELFAPCPSVAMSLAKCVEDDAGCSTCRPARDLLTRAVRAGVDKTARKELFAARFDPARVVPIDIGVSPVKGKKDAPITIVVWSDPQCPACAAVEKVLDMQMERFPEQVRRVQKFYALPSHPNAKDAALAALAAHRQKKFWPMNSTLFAHQDRLGPSDLTGYATQLGLNLKTFDRDRAAKDVQEAFAKDVKQADDLGLDSTPFLFVNGRRVPMVFDFVNEIERWIGLELELAGHTPNAPTEEYAKMRREMGG